MVPANGPPSGAFVGRAHGKESVPAADFRLDLPSWPRHSGIFPGGKFCQTDWRAPAATPAHDDAKLIDQILASKAE